MKPLTIVHTEASRGWGGQDMRVLKECLWFQERGHRVFLVTPADGELFKHAANTPLETISLPLTKGSQFADFFRLKKIFRKIRPDVIGTHSSVDSWVGLTAGAWCGVPCRLRYRHFAARVKASAANRWQYHKLTHGIITTGACIGDWLHEDLGVRREKILVAPTGITPPQTLPDRETARRMICEELQLPPETRFIGQVAQLRGLKGHKFLIPAFEKIAGAFPNYHLILVGDGPVLEEIRAQIAVSTCAGRIHLAGFRKDPWPWFAAMDICTLVSTRGESQPQVLRQAMLTGTPVLGTNVGGIPEVILDGKTGTIVPPADPEVLAGGLAKILNDTDHAQRMSKAAYAEVLATGTVDAMGESVLRFINKNLRYNSLSK